MQIDLAPGLHMSGGYEMIVTAMDVFSRFLSAYATSKQDNETNSRNNIKTKHANSTTTNLR